MLQSCDAQMAVSPESHVGFLMEAAAPLNLTRCGLPSEFDAVAEADVDLVTMDGDELAYLQYTYGSNRFPRGVATTQKVELANLSEIAPHEHKITNGARMARKKKS